MRKINFSDNVISIDGRDIELEHEILDVKQVGEVIVVLFDPDVYTSKFGQFRNVIAIDEKGTVIWVAELPTSLNGDCYYKISSSDPLTLHSVQSFQCVLDTNSGKIFDKDFVK